MDQNKRRTLKLLAAASTTSISAMAATAVSTTTASAASTTSIQENNSCGHLKIQIITGRVAPEDTVILVNDTNQEVLVSEFLPGLITQNNQMLNLKAVLNKGDILLKPGYPVASKAASWQPLSLDATHSYLWCDTAVNMLPDSDTGIITLHAVVNNGYALLTAVHNEPLHNEIGFS